MATSNKSTIANRIIEQARISGADLAGFALVADLKRAPSFTFAPKMGGASQGLGGSSCQPGRKPGEAAWPEKAESVLVIAVEHPAEKPEMDWWFGRLDPPGNRILAGIVRQLCGWIPETFGIGTFHLPYDVEKGGTYLKDAAVLAGLGCIGKNNILITPGYGPRVRLRALTLDVALPPTGPVDFDPCAECGMPCREACPHGAFNEQLYNMEDYGQRQLPGRTGVFSRSACNVEMEANEEAAQEQEMEGFGEPVKLIRYCRRCELACPAGRRKP